MNEPKSTEPLEGLARFLRTAARQGMTSASAETLEGWANEVESSLKTRGGIEPVAWLCEFVREDDSIDKQVVLIDPECTRWADVPDSDGVSPFRVTPLYAASPVGQDSAAPSGENGNAHD